MPNHIAQCQDKLLLRRWQAGEQSVYVVVHVTPYVSEVTAAHARVLH